jgi:1-acyl-sn-glycerol-3-phosphate acyltransferase
MYLNANTSSYGFLANWNVTFAAMRDAVLLPFMVLWKIWFLVVFAVSGLLFYPIFKYQLNKHKRRGALNLLRLWSLLVQGVTGLRIIRRGKFKFPEPPYIVISNHSSYLDIVLLFSIIPDYFAFLGKAELKDWPIVKIFFTSGMQIPVPRASRRGSAEAYQLSKQALENGTSLVIFPEGTIPNHVPRMKKFKSGAFRLAIETKVPIVALSFPKNYRRMMNGGFFKAMASPGFAPVNFHEIVYTQNLSEQDVIPLQERLFATIEKALDHGNK